MHCRRAWALAGLFVLVSCGGGSSPTSPTPAPAATPSGTWSGTLSNPVDGEGAMQLSLDAMGVGEFTGTWSVQFRNGVAASGAAVAVESQQRSYGVTLYVDPQPPCAGESAGAAALLGFQLINVAITTNRLTAVAGRLSCSGLTFGSADLSKP